MQNRALAAAAATTVTLLAATVAGCGGHPGAAATTPPLPSPSRSAAPAPSPTHPVLVSPLTGIRVAVLRPVIGVKIDNVGSSGQNGLDAADVVYAEEVEGGLTRLLAVFSSTPPRAAGPVRSARESDLELLAQYGRIALAFSGANSGVLAEVTAANLRNDSADAASAAYSMDQQRSSPYRFLVDVAALAATHPGALAKDVGFRFGVADVTALVAAALGAPAPPGRTFRVPYPAAVMTGSYTAAGYVIARNGADLDSDGAEVTATNVLLQFVPVRGSRFTDHLHNPTPFSVTVGSGHAVLLRGGREYTGTWSRASPTAPTRWTAVGGGSLTLAPGRTWVFLVPIGTAVTVG